MGVCVLGRSFDGTLLSWCEYRSMNIYRFDGERPIYCKNLSLLHTSWCCSLLDNPNDSSSDCHIESSPQILLLYLCMFHRRACVYSTRTYSTLGSSPVRLCRRSTRFQHRYVTSALSCNLLTYLYLTYLTYLIMEARTQYVYHFLSTLPEVHVLSAVNVTVRRCVR